MLNNHLHLPEYLRAIKAFFICYFCVEMDTHRIFEISSEEEFNALALEVFEYQYQKTDVYREFCQHLGISPSTTASLDQIPFLPIEFFKSRRVLATERIPELCFKSSGTTSTNVSQHYVADPQIYRQSFNQGFKYFYGDISKFCILALLPSYLERQDSSLVYMVSELIRQSPFEESGFYLSDLERLADQLAHLKSSNTAVILIGVTFALIDLASQYNMSLPNTIVMETGGMKGRKREIVREEVHQILKNAWGLKNIHSEYGMTELLSQAYSRGEGIFRCPPWMRIMIRDPEDPLKLVKAGVSGGINIIDLANIYSCSFIATQDLGKLRSDGGFEVLGRFDHSDIRGCNLMAI